MEGEERGGRVLDLPGDPKPATPLVAGERKWYGSINGKTCQLENDSNGKHGNTAVITAGMWKILQ